MKNEKAVCKFNSFMLLVSIIWMWFLLYTKTIKSQ